MIEAHLEQQAWPALTKTAVAGRTRKGGMHGSKQIGKQILQQERQKTETEATSTEIEAPQMRYKRFFQIVHVQMYFQINAIRNSHDDERSSLLLLAGLGPPLQQVFHEYHLVKLSDCPVSTLFSGAKVKKVALNLDLSRFFPNPVPHVPCFWLSGLCRKTTPGCFQQRLEGFDLMQVRGNSWRACSNSMIINAIRCSL